ncbi:hypothetical protein B0H19DRAFT_1253681 [Mycena capillaripes]|nr:hypothetical protein B0H19DRAFT_1253681 [Mycena capillaripes]
MDFAILLLSIETSIRLRRHKPEDFMPQADELTADEEYDDLPELIDAPDNDGIASHCHICCRCYSTAVKAKL